MWSPSKREDSGKIYHLWKTALSLFKNANHYCYGYDKMDNYCMIEVPGKSYVEFAKLSVPHDPVEGKKLPKNHPAINMMSSWLALTAPRYFGLSILMKDKTPAGQTSEYREGFFLPLFQNDPRIPERYRNSEIPEKYRNEFGHIYLVRSTPKKNMFKYYTHADSKQGLEAQLDAAINLYSMGKRVT